MKNIYLVVSYVDYSMAENIINRINLLKSEDYNIYVLGFDGSYLNFLESKCNIMNVKFERIYRYSFDRRLTIQNEPFLLSWFVYNKIKNVKIDEIYFIDLLGIGYHCIQAKKMGISFLETNLNVYMFGASQYNNETSEEWGYGGFEQLMIQYMERYCCEFCDKLISSTYSLIDWAIKRRWNLTKKISIIGFSPITNLELKYNLNQEKKCLIYCGELSKKGGLHLFINALLRMSTSMIKNKMSKILFVGEHKKIDGLNSEEYINNMLKSSGYNYKIVGALETKQLLMTASANDAILVFPSSASLISEKLISALKCDIKMIVTNNPAHSEIFHIESLSELTPVGIIDSIVNNKFAVEKPDRKNSYNNCTDTSKIKSERVPLVSICTAYYNHGKFLDMARKSIESQDYPNIEWIVVDDGSTDKYSVELLDKYRIENNNKPYKFLQKNNEGPSVARNYAAEHANGEYLIFMDSDNIAKKNMVSNFVSAMLYSDSDCLTCYFDEFNGEGEVNSNSLNGITYALLGPSLETGAFTNCFGDTNFIIKKSVFQEAGCFLPQRVVTEDWQLLARVALKGYKIDVIPEPLFWYRVLPESNVSYGSEYYKQQLILQTYCNDLPPYVYHVFNSLCRPTLSVNESLSQTDTGKVYIKIINKINKIFPTGSKRRHLLKVLAKIITK